MIGNMESKYYIPSIEEFYIGFEYEYQSYDKKNWTKCVVSKNDVTSSKMDWCSSNWIEDVFSSIEKGGVRIKYLDKEDIESLGFVFKDIGIYYKSPFNNQNYTLCYITETNFLNITNQDFSNHVFNGYIKNKSELIKLMKQLGI